MKALVLHQVGSLEALRWEDVPSQPLGDFDVNVRIEAASLNYRDYAMAMGIYAIPGGTPMVLGSDAAGEVVQVGRQVTRFRPGDRVISLLRQKWQGGDFDEAKAAAQLGGTVSGVFAQMRVFNEETIVKAPDQMTYEEAATLPTAGLIAYRCLLESRLSPGDLVLVQGTGGVSLFALQLAKIWGLRVIALSSGANKAEFLRSLGADHVIDYKDKPDWNREIRQLTGQRGVDLAIDVVGGDSVARSIDSVKINGQVAIVGFLEKTTSQIDLVPVIRNSIQLSGYTTGSRDHLEAFVKMLNAFEVKPVIASVFDNFQSAFEAFNQSRKPGKLVVRVPA